MRAQCPTPFEMSHLVKAQQLDPSASRPRGRMTLLTTNPKELQCQLHGHQSIAAESLGVRNGFGIDLLAVQEVLIRL